MSARARPVEPRAVRQRPGTNGRERRTACVRPAANCAPPAGIGRGSGIGLPTGVAPDGRAVHRRGGANAVPALAAGPIESVIEGT